MNPISILIFCAASLLGSVAIAYALYPQARLDDEVLKSTSSPKAIEDFDQLIDMGEDYGQLSVIELMGFYMDSPPAPKTQGTQAAPTRNFGGC